MFKLVKIEGSRINVPEPEYLTVGTAAVVCGEGLILSSGKLVNCGTAKPTYIALSGADAGAKVAVGRVTPDWVLDVELNAAPTSLVPGAKVALVGGLKVAGAASDTGVATIISTLGATLAGDVVRVRFS
ncbi:MAG: hypothetical protein IJW48_04820 [Clostridia bacterium]|nr:hypothetical protein [Clostridia bacterium]